MAKQQKGRVVLKKLVNDEFVKVDYGVKSKIGLYIKLGFLVIVEDVAKQVVKRAEAAVRRMQNAAWVQKVKQTLTFDEFREVNFDGAILATGKNGEFKGFYVKEDPLYVWE